jgi:hypothetical protein
LNAPFYRGEKLTAASAKRERKDYSMKSAEARNLWGISVGQKPPGTTIEKAFWRLPRAAVRAESRAICAAIEKFLNILSS